MRKFGKLIVDILGTYAPLMPLALAMLLGAAILLMPAQSHSPTVEPSAPIASAPVALPECVTEDGAGMALCVFIDRKYDGQGDIMRGNVISGDCAPDIVGGSEASALCVQLHAMPASTYTYQDAEITIPTGPDRVSECTDDRELGMPVIECIKAQMLMGGVE